MLLGAIGTACGAGTAIPSDGAVARDAVLRLDDLPAASVPIDRPLDENPCSPGTHFRQRSAQVETAAFAVDGTAVMQTVGVFEDAARARAAIRRFLSARNRACTAREVRDAHDARAVVRPLAVASSLPGYEAGGISVVARRGRSSVTLRTVAVRVGRGVACTAFLSRVPAAESELPMPIVRTAAKRLAGSMDS